MNTVIIARAIHSQLIKAHANVQTDATSHSIGLNNVGSCWHMQTNTTPANIVVVNNNPFYPKLFLYLFVGPLTFFLK